MTVRSKALWAMISFCVLFFAVFALTYRWSMLQEADRADQISLGQDLNRIYMTLKQEQRELLRITRDWANWDDTYDFVQNGTFRFLDASLSPEKMALTIQVDDLAVAMQSGHILFTRSLMPGTLKPRETPYNLPGLFKPQGPLFPPTVPDEGRVGFMWLGRYPAIVAAYPIRDSKEQMPRTGLFFVSRSLQGERLRKIADITQLNIRIVPNHEIPQGLKFNPDDDVPMGRWILDPSEHEGYVMLRNFDDKGAFWVAVKAKRDRYQRAMGEMLRNGAMMLFMATTLGILALWVLDRFILSRVENLHRTIQDIKFYSDETVPVDDCEDEISALGKTLNEALNAIRENFREREKAEMDARLAHLELAEAYEKTIEGWSLALDLRDKETEGHTRRVTELTVALAERMGYPEDRIIHLRRGAILHDIGKLGIPDSILLKQGPLTDEEWEIMKRHPLYAYDMLTPIQYLHPAIPIPYCHHEKWDGTGYPQGLKGTAIPLSARMFAVVDIWDALTSDRPYRKAWERQRTMEYIASLKGYHLDPDVVAHFLNMMDRS
ncbi:HD-GYP domain-containing protein [Thermanaerovibrio velox DSM 12556]|uniref:HD-GYP domain-containing protein n=1 Tax=Thermanaerovibrio velox DSM 12556 TaxID=926567 RepID=H0UNH4_9BACT|nr:HD domain-containing phosphohydrolase [Thermanaerovibrio velox]EHM09381.1 HD-GYP domain-containing protein [Thermanaerovibrio velox DSM 12556]